MGVDINVFRLNKTPFSWTSCSFTMDLFPIQGIVALDWEQKRERKVVYAANRDGTPLGKTSGKYSVEGFTMKCLRDTAMAVKTYLTAKGLGSYGDASFVLGVQIAEPVIPPSPPIICLANDCTIDGVKDVHEEGIDELVTEFTIGSLLIIENGTQLASVVRGLPLP